MFDVRVPLNTSLRTQAPRGCEQTQLPRVWSWHDRRWRSVTAHRQPSTGSCPVPPWLTRGSEPELGLHSLLCEILIAGFWLATAAPGLLSLVSCMRSLMMACLSTEPAGTPGRLSGKSCGNWLFCRSSRISSKLSNSLPGCNREHTNPQYRSLLACCWRPACAKPGSPQCHTCNTPDVEKAPKPVGRGLCWPPRASLPCFWRAQCGTDIPSKAPCRDA